MDVTGSMLRNQVAVDSDSSSLVFELNHRQLKSAPKTANLDKRVALLQVHFEGNVGDQMETIPLLKRLHGR